MSADQPPNPFSREGASPDDQQGGTSNTRPKASDSEPKSNPDPGEQQYGERPWPTYQPRPEPTVPLGDDPYSPPSRPPTVGYGPPPYPGMPAYDAEQPYGNNYGDSPYEMNRYQPQFGSATPYQPDYGSSASYGPPAVQHPQAIIALVLGIVSLAVCPLIGIAALVVGNKARKEIDASPGQFAGRGMATAGYVLGIISVVLTVLVILIILLGVASALGS